MTGPDTPLPADWGASDPTLIADTPTSRVWRVRLVAGGTAVVKELRPIGVEDEARGADYLAWRDGYGCVRLLARAGPTLLLEDAGDRSLLTHLARYGDDAATSIMADALATIHRPSRTRPPLLQPLAEQFAALLTLAARADAEPLLVRGAHVAQTLLDGQRDVQPLHGDLHHENLIRAARGWLAIDPKGLIGDPAYDAANMFYNPLARDDLRTDPVRISSMARVFADALGRDPATMMRFAFAHACLSASWHTEDGNLTEASRDLDAAAAIHSVLGT